MIHETFHHLPEEKKNRLFQAAYKEFAQNTFEKSSINRILDDARISKGSFYQYFDNKEDLFFLCIRNICEKAISQLNTDKPLDQGIIQAKKLGLKEAAVMFTSVIYKYLDEVEQKVFKHLIEAPDSIRNNTLLRISYEFNVPVIKAEFKKYDSIRQDIDQDYYAYLLSLSEAMAIDYCKRHNASEEDMMHYNYMFLKTIYKAIMK